MVRGAGFEPATTTVSRQVHGRIRWHSRARFYCRQIVDVFPCDMRTGWHIAGVEGISPRRKRKHEYLRKTRSLLHKESRQQHHGGFPRRTVRRRHERRGRCCVGHLGCDWRTRRPTARRGGPRCVVGRRQGPPCREIRQALILTPPAGSRGSLQAAPDGPKQNKP